MDIFTSRGKYSGFFMFFSENPTKHNILKYAPLPD